jgi:hypothetical protein
VSARYRGRVRGRDAGRVLLAVVLIVLTTLIAMLGTVPDAGAGNVAAAHSVGASTVSH